MKGHVGMAFAQRLRLLRTNHGLTQESLADRSGLHLTYIAGLESGRRNPTLNSLSAVAAGLGISLSDLLENVPAVVKQ